MSAGYPPGTTQRDLDRALEDEDEVDVEEEPEPDWDIAAPGGAQGARR